MRKLLFIIFVLVAGSPAFSIDCHYKLPGDYNLDCQTNITDLAYLLSSWMIDCNSLPLDPTCIALDPGDATPQCQYQLPGDYNFDCQATIQDFPYLANSWTINCNAMPLNPACVPLDIDQDGFDISLDCDDHNPLIYPGAVELCDGIDNDCNSLVDEGCPDFDGDGIADAIDNCINDYNPAQTDSDFDGYGFACDCDDNEPAAYPGNAEICDGIDNDCDSLTDNGLTPPLCSKQNGVCAGSTQLCGGALGWLTCIDIDYPPTYEPIEVTCDGLDNDCDGLEDEGCVDTDGDGVVDEIDNCPGDPNPAQTDDDFDGYGFACECNDSDPDTYPGAPEICNGTDNDCDTIIDNNLAPPLCIKQNGVCAGSTETCGGALGWLECIDQDYPPTYEPTELTCDGLDNDCDGLVDEGCPDTDGDGVVDALDNCPDDFNPVQTNNDSDGFGLLCDCNDSDPDTYPGAPEMCDAIDNDCDTIIDNNLTPAPCPKQNGVCAGSTVPCGGALGWLICTSAVYPPTYEPNEVTCDGLDNDCDGLEDEGCPDFDGDGVVDAIDNCPDDFNPAQTDTDLDGYGLACECNDSDPTAYPGAAEICDGIDNDCDTLTDNGLTPPLCTKQDGVCAASTQTCGGASGWLTCTAPDYPPTYESTEVSCDGLDNDCDGLIDEGCPDSDTDGVIDALDNCPGNYNPGQLDNDFDGYGFVCECNDSDPDTYPGAVEMCNGIDNDCDTIIDNGLTPPLCTKQDGVCAASTQTCGGVSGWLTCTAPDYPPTYELTEVSCDGLDNDCDGLLDEGCPDSDGDGVIDELDNCPGTPNPTQTDDDGDGFGLACECNDTRPDAYPGAPEVCDGIDNDCDTLTDNGLTPPLCTKQDGVCAASIESCGGASGWLTCTAPDYPPTYELTETSCDGLDNDCDGTTDEGCPDSDGDGVIDALDNCPGNYNPGQIDSDGDGYGLVCECNDSEPTAYPGAVEICDGIDNNCDTIIDNGLTPPLCSKQDGVCAASTQTCGGASGWLTCTTAEYPPNYEAIETTCDAFDNDCDGTTDEDCADTDADGVVDALDNCPFDPNPAQTNSDFDGYGLACDCNDSDPDIYPGAAEICDGIDNNCDTFTDNGLTPPLCIKQNGVCAGATQTCGGALGWLTCTAPDYPPTYETTETICDGLDNDCDGLEDEGCPDSDGDGVVDAIDNCPSGYNPGQLDSDSDGYGAVCECNDTEPTAYPGATETCDGLDNDCDTFTDNGLTPPLCTKQDGICAGSTESCGGASGWLTCTNAEYPPAYEPTEATCDGIDNDCDGTIDENPSILCPLPPNVASTTCAGSCAIGTCDPGYQDMDEVYANGCECSDDLYEFSNNNVCSSAYYFGFFMDLYGDLTTLDGNLSESADIDWYMFITDDDPSANYNTRVRFLTNPGGEFFFEIYKQSCATSSVFSGTDFSDPETPSNDSDIYYIRVLRNTGFPVTCNTYTLEVSNGVY